MGPLYPLSPSPVYTYILFGRLSSSNFKSTYAMQCKCMLLFQQLTFFHSLFDYHHHFQFQLLNTHNIISLFLSSLSNTFFLFLFNLIFQITPFFSFLHVISFFFDNFMTWIFGLDFNLTVPKKVSSIHRKIN